MDISLSKALHYSIAALAVLAIGWFGYHWQRGTDPLDISALAQTSGQTKQSGKPDRTKKPGKPGAAGRRSRGPVPVEVTPVIQTTVEQRVSAVGNLLAARSVLLKPEINGRISKVSIADGALVSAAQPVFKLDTAVVDAQVSQAQAELRLAQNNLRRTRNLAKQNFVSRRSRDEAASNVTVLRARLEVMKAQQAQAIVVAPFAGRVGLVSVNEGDYVKSGAELVRLDDLSSLKLDIRVPERLFAALKVGQPIRVQIDAYPERAFEAKVETIDSQIDQAGRSVVVRGRLDNQSGLLRPGMFAKAALVLASRDNALMVPETTLIPGQSGKAVYRVVDGVATRTLVKTGVRQDGKVEVLDGLNAGDRVVSAGLIKLRGPTVKIRELSDKKTAPKTRAQAAKRQ